jgi:hypothetical protein
VLFSDTLAEIDSMMPGGNHELKVRDAGDVRPAREISQSEIAEVLSMHGDLMDLPRTSLEKAIRIGEKLRGWRNLFPPRSGWHQWCADRIPHISRSTIERYIRAADHQGELLRVTNDAYSEPLTLTQALNLLKDEKTDTDPVEAAKPAKRPKQSPVKPEPTPKPEPVEVEANVVPFEPVVVKTEAPGINAPPINPFLQARETAKFINLVAEVKVETIQAFENFLSGWEHKKHNAVMQVVYDFITVEMKRAAAAALSGGGK